MPHVLIDPKQQDFRAESRGTRSNEPVARAHAPPGDSIGAVPGSRGFAALLAAFRASGGTARGDDVARLLEDHGIGDFVGLARLIASRELFGFKWRGTLWIPMFQFELLDLSIKPATRSVLMELGTDLDGWAQAAWFARPNPCLGGGRPVDLLETSLAEVLGAARVNRFMADG